MYTKLLPSQTKQSHRHTFSNYYPITNYASKLLKGKITYRIINHLCTVIWQMHFSLLKTHFHFLSSTLLFLLIIVYLFILTLHLSICQANLLEVLPQLYPCRRPLKQLITNSITLAGILSFQWLICHHRFFSPHFQTHDQLPVSLSLILYQKVNSKL